MKPSNPSTASSANPLPGMHVRQAALNKRQPASNETTGTGTLQLHDRGLHGELWFRLQHHQGGLYVEREEIPQRGLRQLQSMHFRQARDFERWCDNDPVRFEHPRLHVQLKRDAALLWQHRDRIAGDG